MPMQFYTTYNCAYCWRCNFSLSLASIFEYLTTKLGLTVSDESAVIYISSNWEFETGLFVVFVFLKVIKFWSLTFVSAC